MTYYKDMKANIWKAYFFRFFRLMLFVAGLWIPFCMDWGGLSFTGVMILETIYVVGIFILEVPTGAIADYYGRKTSMLLGAAALIASFISFSIIPSFPLFAFANLLWALGFSLISGADEAIVYDSLKNIRKSKDSKKILGNLEIADLLGLMIGGPLGSIIAFTIGIRYTQIINIIPMSIALFLALSMKEPKVRIRKNKGTYWSNMKKSVMYFRDHKELKILSFDMISIGITMFFLWFLYQKLLMDQGISYIYFGFIAAGSTFIQVPVIRYFSKFEKLAGSKKNYLTLSALIGGVSFIALGLLSSFGLIILFIIIASAFGISRRVLFRSYLNKFIESHHRATVLSTISMTEKVFEGLMFPFVGLMGDWSTQWTFIILGLAVIIFALFSRVEEEHLLD